MTMNELQVKVREVGKKRGYESVRRSINFLANEMLMDKDRKKEDISKALVTNEIALMTMYLTELAETLDITDKEICEELKEVGEKQVKVYGNED